MKRRPTPPAPPKKNNSSSVAINCQQILNWSLECQDAFSSMRQYLPSFILCRSFASNHSCFVFMCVTAMIDPEASISLSSKSQALSIPSRMIFPEPQRWGLIQISHQQLSTLSLIVQRDREGSKRLLILSSQFQTPQNHT